MSPPPEELGSCLSQIGGPKYVPVPAPSVRLGPRPLGSPVECPKVEADTAPVVASYQWHLTQPDDLITGSSSAQHVFGIQPRSVAQWLNDVGF
jgi:hypothetical protein